MKLSIELTKFLRDYLAWAYSNTSNAGDSRPVGYPYEATSHFSQSPLGVMYDSECGLCYNAVLYCRDIYSSDGYLKLELADLFEAQGLSEHYPFHAEYDFGDSAYDLWATPGIQHLFKPRLDWINEQLENV